MVSREPVNQPMQTGILAIDAMVPIGRGQRELIIGDRQTGKTAIAARRHPEPEGAGYVICVYVAIGQKASTVAQPARHASAQTRRTRLQRRRSAHRRADGATRMQYIAPYAGCRDRRVFHAVKGRDVLIVYDDLSKHASRLPCTLSSAAGAAAPGREAYPGDVFYLHSRLLERSPAA